MQLSKFVGQELIEAYISNDVNYLYHELDRKLNNIFGFSECNQLLSCI